MDQVTKKQIKKLTLNDNIVIDVTPTSIATSTEAGIIKVGYQENGKNYPVKLENDNAYVYVPWTGGSATDVAVDNITIGKGDAPDYKIYVKEITKNKIVDFGDYLSSNTFIPLSTSQLSNDAGYITLNEVNTDNVILAEDLTFSGNYTLGLKKTKTADVWTAEAGMSLTQLFKELFTGERPDAQPVVTQPSLTLTLKNVSSRVKLGESITPSYELTFNPGKYTTTLDGNTKTQSTNVLDESYTVTFNGETLTTKTGTFTTFTPTSVGTLTMNATVNHSAGDYAKTYNDIVTTVRIEAGSKSNSKTITVYEEAIKIYLVNIVSNTTELDSIDDTTIKTKCAYSDTVRTAKLPYEINGNCGLAIYVNKSESVTGIQVGDMTTYKDTAHNLTNYDCFVTYDETGLIIPKNSDIIYT